MWNYEGQIENGMLNGQGALTFNGLRIGGTRWMHNLDEEVLVSMTNTIEKGYYFILPK